MFSIKLCAGFFSWCQCYGYMMRRLLQARDASKVLISRILCHYIRIYEIIPSLYFVFFFFLLLIHTFILFSMIPWQNLLLLSIFFRLVHSFTNVRYFSFFLYGIFEIQLKSCVCVHLSLLLLPNAIHIW